MKTIFIVIIGIIITLQVKGQNIKHVLPEVGQPMPDFRLDDVQYYKQKKVDLSDFKGQWLILDFWNRYCGVCLKSFPRMDSLQKTFEGKVKIILVGYNGSKYTKQSDDKMIRALYERNRIEGKLNLTIAFDSLLFDRFDIYATPYIIIVDPNGIVKAKTSKVFEKDLEDLLTGKPVALKPAYTFEENKARVRAKYGGKTN
nr:TlpA disulfide reductase family protein [Pedobacter sp. ASV19]